MTFEKPAAEPFAQLISTIAAKQDCPEAWIRAINSLMEMLFKALSLRCQCGRPPLRIKEIGLTAGHELAVYWHCGACKRAVYALKSLSECWADCPKNEASGSPLLLAPPSDQSSEDREFLRRLGVSPDSESESA